MANWRAGRTLARTLYRDEVFVGVVDTAAVAREIVQTMNRDVKPGKPRGGRARGRRPVRLDLCPFCGSSCHKLEVRQGGDVRVTCTGCGAEGPIVRGPLNGDATTKQCCGAELLWNARAR